MSDPNGLGGPLSPRKALAELVQSQPNRLVRKLSFFEQCAAFAALYDKTEPRIVAKAFGISRTAVSQLAGCLERDPRPTQIELVAETVEEPIYGFHTKTGEEKIIGVNRVPTGQIVEQRINRDMNARRNPNRLARYHRVAEAFEGMGEEAFFAKYFTHAIVERLRKAQYDIDGEASRRTRQGPDPERDEGQDFIIDPDDGAQVHCKWLTDPRPHGDPGWWVVGQFVDMGREYEEGGDRRPFKTKYDGLAAYCRLAQINPPPKPPRK